MGFNTLLADTSGNIAYYLPASVPVRKDKTPYLGCRVLDGRTTKFDWVWGELVPLRDLPRSINPKKGYFVSANGLVTTEHATSEVGISMGPTLRHVRMNELISEQIASGKKFTLNDVQAIQQDVIDVVARRITPQIVQITEEVTHHLTQQQKQDLNEMLDYLRGWDGSFDVDSIAATVYSRWDIQLTRHLFMGLGGQEEGQRLAYFEGV